MATGEHIAPYAAESIQETISPTFWAALIQLVLGMFGDWCDRDDDVPPRPEVAARRLRNPSNDDLNELWADCYHTARSQVRRDRVNGRRENRRDWRNRQYEVAATMFRTLRDQGANADKATAVAYAECLLQD